MERERRENVAATTIQALTRGVLLRRAQARRRWAAVAVGFLGVVVITRPGTNVFQLAALFP